MTRQALAVVWCCFLLVASVYAAEWDCASNAVVTIYNTTIDGNYGGMFIYSSNVTMTNTII